MTTLKEIEKAVKMLSTNDLLQFRDWFAAFEAEKWDKKIEKDAHDGSLDFLAAEAESEYKSGKTSEL